MLSEKKNSPYFRKKKISNKDNILIDNQLLQNFPINYKECRFIILDTETTGLDIHLDKLISINAVEMINTELTGIQFNAYLHKRFSDNTRPLMYYLSDYNYSRENNIKKSLETFLEFVSDSIIITHNALFDMKFINAELKRCGLKQIPLSQCICTLRILRNFKKFGILNQNYKLRLCDLCRYYSIDVDPKDLHQGIVDAIVFGRCLAKMLDDGININYENYDYYDEVNSFINYSHFDTDYNFESSYYDINSESNRNKEDKKDKKYEYNNRIINNQIKSKSEEKERKDKNNNVNFYHTNNFKKKFKKRIKNKKNNNFNNVSNNNKNNKKEKEKNHQENVEKYIKHNDNTLNKDNYLYNSVNTEKNNNNDMDNKKEISLSINDYNNNNLNVDMDKEDTKISFIKEAFKCYIKDNQQKNKIIYK